MYQNMKIKQRIFVIQQHSSMNFIERGEEIPILYKYAINLMLSKENRKIKF